MQPSALWNSRPALGKSFILPHETIVTALFRTLIETRIKTLVGTLIRTPIMTLIKSSIKGLIRLYHKVPNLGFVKLVSVCIDSHLRYGRNRHAPPAAVNITPSGAFGISAVLCFTGWM
jgi:hypothetical protein